jgi:hypothetical protein
MLMIIWLSVRWYVCEFPEYCGRKLVVCTLKRDIGT